MDSELKTLRKELAILGDEFSQRVKVIEQRIDHLEAKGIWAAGTLPSSYENSNLHANQSSDVGIKENIVVQNSTPVLVDAVFDKNDVLDETTVVNIKPEKIVHQTEK
ncbi:MAG: hypothetical protein ACI9LM_005593 [Alteromonadaceae bacterium]|jgi:hypothetical protein